MAKVKKKLQNLPSARSRTARRAATAMDVDVPPKRTKDEADDSKESSWKYPTHLDGGISKKKAKKPMKRQQRLRWEKGVARADIVKDQLEKKVTLSRRQGKKIKERRATWEDLNGTDTTTNNNRTKHAQRLADNADHTMNDIEAPVRQESTTNTGGSSDQIPNVRLPKAPIVSVEQEDLFDKIT